MNDKEMLRYGLDITVKNFTCGLRVFGYTLKEHAQDASGSRDVYERDGVKFVLELSIPKEKQS